MLLIVVPAVSLDSETPVGLVVGASGVETAIGKELRFVVEIAVGLEKTIAETAAGTLIVAAQNH